jgi:integrase
MDLNSLYRKLLESGRRPQGTPPRQHDPTSVALIEELHGNGLTWQQVADEVGDRAPELAGITRHAGASIHRRACEPRPAKHPVPGLSNRSVRYVHTIVHAALRDALRWNRVNRNVADAATPPPVGSTRRGRHTVWTGDQLGRFLDFVADSPYLPAWLFLATSGSRRGEVLGLKWHDLNLDAATAIMSRQVTMVDHRIVVKELPKTKAGHTILLDPATVEMLRLHLETQAELERLLDGAYHDDGWVFCRADGTTFHPERFSRQFLRKQETYNAAHPNAPLPRLKLHGLRHTWATLALQEGIDIHIVSDRLNHSSTHITSEIYTHVTRPMQSDAADRVAASILRRP